MKSRLRRFIIYKSDRISYYIEETELLHRNRFSLFKFIYYSEVKYIKIRAGYFPRRAISHATHGQIFLHDRISVRLRSYDITSVRWKMHYIGCSVAGSIQSFPRKCDSIKVDPLGTILLMIYTSKMCWKYTAGVPLIKNSRLYCNNIRSVWCAINVNPIERYPAFVRFEMCADPLQMWREREPQRPQKS